MERYALSGTGKLTLGVQSHPRRQPSQRESCDLPTTRGAGPQFAHLAPAIEVVLEGEVVVDRGVRSEKALGASSRLEPLLLSPSAPKELSG